MDKQNSILSFNPIMTTKPRIINTNYWYRDDDITDYVNTIIKRELGGYRNDCHFLLKSMGDGCFPEDEGSQRYLVAVTAAIDTTQQASPIAFYLDKAKQQAPDLGKPDERRDVFDELMPVLMESDEQHAKILFPFNITQLHWLTGEIKLHKTGHKYVVKISVHDPYGGDELKEETYEVLKAAIDKRIKQTHPSSIIDFEKNQSFYQSRQPASDTTSCGVITADDIIKRIKGESLNLPQPYPKGAKTLRKNQVEAIKNYRPEHDSSRKKFINRTTSEIPPNNEKSLQGEFDIPNSNEDPSNVAQTSNNEDNWQHQNQASDKGYRKGKSLIPGLEGTTYQIAMLMKYAFLAYKANATFELRTEAEDFDKFDDVVIHYAYHSEVAQVKHGHDDTANYTLKDFIENPADKITNSKKVQLSKYFDSWYKIRCKYKDKPINFKLISNYKAEFLTDTCFDKEEMKFKGDFVKNQNLNNNDKILRESIENCIKEYGRAFWERNLLNGIKFKLKNSDKIPELKLNVAELKTKDNHSLQFLLTNHIEYIHPHKTKAKLLENNFTNSLYKPSQLLIPHPELKIIMPQEDTIKSKITTLVGSFETNSNMVVTWEYKQKKNKKNENKKRESYEQEINALLLLSGLLVKDSNNPEYWHLKQNFIDGVSLTTLQKHLRNKLIEQFKTLINKNDQTLINKLIKLIKEFLAEFTLTIEQQRVQELDAWLQTEILSKFETVLPGHYEAFYLEILFWLRDRSNIHTNLTIKQFFTEVNARLSWISLVGMSCDYISRTVNKLPKIYPDNASEIKELTNKINTNDVIILQSDSVAACSTVINQYLVEKNFKLGACIFIPADILLDKERQGAYLKVISAKGLDHIIIDHADAFFANQNSELLKKWLNASVINKKKLIFCVNITLKTNLNVIKELKYITIIIGPLKKGHIKNICTELKIANFPVLNKIITLESLLQLPEHNALYQFFTNLNNLLDLQTVPAQNHLSGDESYVPPMVTHKRFVYSFNRISQWWQQKNGIMQVHAGPNELNDVLSNFKEPIIIDPANYIFENNNKKLIDDLLLADNVVQASKEAIIVLTINQLNTTNDAKFIVNDLLQSDFRKLIIVLQNEAEFIAIDSLVNVVLRNKTEADFSCLIESHNFQQLPDPIAKFKEPVNTHTSILQRSNHTKRILLQAKPGLGKTKLASILAEQQLSEFVPENYLFVFLIKLNEVDKSYLSLKSESDIHTLRNIILRRVLNWPAELFGSVQARLLELMLQQGNIILCADGLDEITATQQIAECRAIFSAIFQYRNLLVTARPHAALPFVPTQVLTLEFFNKQHTINFVSKYISTNRIFSVDNCLDNVNELLTAEAMEKLLQVPLHCQLFCEMAFTTKKALTLEEMRLTTRLKLYQQLLIRKIKIFLNKENLENVSDDAVYTRCYQYIKIICRQAAHQLGLGRDTLIKIDNPSITALNTLAIMKFKKSTDGYVLIPHHQTILEYCAALYIAKGLCDKYRSNDYVQLIKARRYDASFETVWQFVVRILIEGDLFIGSKKDIGLENFCKAMFAKPHDLLGNRHIELVNVCFISSDIETIKTINQKIAEHINSLIVKSLRGPSTPLAVVATSKRIIAPSPVELSEEQKYKFAFNIFHTKEFDYRNNFRFSINDAQQNLRSLTNHNLIINAVKEFIDFIKKNEKKLNDIGIKNKVTWALTVLSELDSKLSDADKQKRELLILQIFDSINNKSGKKSAWLEQDLFAALSKLRLTSIEAVNTVKRYIKQIKFGMENLLNASVDCLLNAATSGLVERTDLIADLINIIKHNNSSPELKYCALEKLTTFHKLNLEEEVVYLKNIAATTSNNNLIAKVINKLDNFSKNNQGLSNFIVDTLIQALKNGKSSLNFVFQHIEKMGPLQIEELFNFFIYYLSNNSNKLIYFYINNEAFNMEEIFKFLDKLLIMEPELLISKKNKLADLLKNVGQCFEIFRLMLKHNLIDDKIIQDLLQHNCYKNEKICGALTLLPQEKFNESILQFLLDNFKDDLFIGFNKLLSENKINRTIFQSNQIEQIKQKGINFLKNESSSETVFSVLCVCLGQVQAEEIYIKTIPEYPAYEEICYGIGEISVSSSPALKNFNSKPDSNIVAQFSLQALGETWKEFCKDIKLADNPIDVSKNWYFKIIESYIIHYKLAVVTTENPLNNEISLVINIPAKLLKLRLPSNGKCAENMGGQLKEKLCEYLKRQANGEYIKALSLLPEINITSNENTYWADATETRSTIIFNL